MGRPRNGVPYLKQGVYHVRFAGDKESTSLNTRNKHQAASTLGVVLQRRGIQSTTTNTPSNTGGNVVPRSGDISTSNDSPLGAWLAGDSQFTAPEQPDTSPAQGSADGGGRIPDGLSKSPLDGTASPYVSYDVQLPTENPSLSITASLAPSVGLSFEEKQRMHGLLAGIVGRINILAVGATVHIFGRIPAEPDPKDTELLDKAWQMQLSVWFADKEIQPYVLIIGASLGLAVGMWANGEKKVKKNAKDSQSIPTDLGAP